MPATDVKQPFASEAASQLHNTNLHGGEAMQFWYSQRY
jgi:hypothetical protein